MFSFRDCWFNVTSVCSPAFESKISVLTKRHMWKRVFALFACFTMDRYLNYHYLKRKRNMKLIECQNRKYCIVRWILQIVWCLNSYNHIFNEKNFIKFPNTVSIENHMSIRRWINNCVNTGENFLALLCENLFYISAVLVVWNRKFMWKYILYLSKT